MNEWIPYILIISVILFFAVLILTARNRMKRVYKRYMKVPNSISLTGEQYAFLLKDYLKLNNLKLAMSQIELSDAYSSKEKTLILSKDVCTTASLSSIAIVSHEIGHALQDKTNNLLMKCSQIFRKITRFTNTLIFPFLLLSLIVLLFDEFDNSMAITFLYISAILFVFFIFSNLLMIPLEYDASRIGLNLIKQNKLLKPAELDRVKYLLNIAAQTYIAYFFSELFTFGYKKKY